MNNKAVIIISNEYETKIPLYVCPCNNQHKEGVMNFIYQNDISLPETKNLTTQEISFTLGEDGFCVLLYSEEANRKDLVAFIPNQISPNQYNWFKKREKELIKYNLAFFNYTQNGTWYPVDKTTTETPIIEELMNQLNEKAIPTTTNLKR